MLSTIIIKRLFNLYDYHLDMTNVDGSLVKFITAPNGYGKTTLLQFIYDVMTETYNRLFLVPFEEFILVFSTDVESVRDVITVKRVVIQQIQDEESDERTGIATKLVISLKRTTAEEEVVIQAFSLIKESEKAVVKEGDSNNIELFFASRTCYYITDKRLLTIKTDAIDGSTHFDEVSLKDFSEDMKRILSDPSKRVEFAQRIEVFKQVINRCEYAHKRLEVDERFGFRFVATDEVETKLSLDDLSSGEKSMLIQVFALLFKAQTGTLVLIDEPELSLHMMWQMNYLKNLEEIISVRGFQCVVATHSPQVFNSLWSKSIDLYSLSEV